MDFGAPQATHLRWRAWLLRRDDDGEIQRLSQTEMDSILDSCLNKFASFFITTTAMQGSGAQQQLWYRSLFARYHGVSRSALDVFAKAGFFLPLTSFDRKVKEVNAERKAAVRSGHLCCQLCEHKVQTKLILIFFAFRDAEAQPHTIWWDNFSKIYSKKMPSLSEGAYALCHWTGKAIRTSKQYFDIRIRHDADDQPIPAMPDDLFEEEPALVAKMAAITSPLGNVNVMLQYRSSKVIAWEVFNVPPRPKEDKADLQYGPVLRQRVDTVKGQSFIPCGILKLNINSNEDLCRIVRNHYEARNMHITGPMECSSYEAVSTDMAIFHRILKVCDIVALSSGIPVILLIFLTASI